MSIYFHYIRQEWRGFLGTASMLALCSLLRVTHALMNAFVLTALVAGRLNAFFGYLLMDGCVFLALCILLMFTDWRRAKTVGLMGIDLRADIARSLATRTYADFMKRDTGVYTSWMTNDVTQIESRGFNNIFNVVQTITDPLFSIIALFSYHWSLVVLAFAIGFLTVGVPQLIRKRLQRASLATSKQNEELFNDISTQLHGFETLFVLGLQANLIKAVRIAAQKVLGKQLHQVSYETVANNTSGFINISGQIMITGWTGFLAFHKVVAIGAVNSTVNLSYNILNCLAAVSPIITQMQSLKAIFAKYDLNLQASGVDVAPLAEAKTDAAVKITDLSFTYPEKDAAILKNINLTIPAGGHVLITGESGAGKSTLMNILAGKLTEYSGSIKIGGRELREFANNDVQQTVMYVGQRPYMFNGSIVDNLKLGQDFTDAEITEALRRADIFDFVHTLPDGLDTQVGENGKNLSGGQQQRLALARCLLRMKERKVILLDEVTNSLSEQSAVTIERNLLTATAITVLCVTHQVHAETVGLFEQRLSL